ncbi:MULTISPECIES: biotin--[acetyl-CoA-carboxylase] ligase [unclassified Marinobacter]|uniref:biotin--[acetyl-CoA-carboxylase] ligase n=1 Tax=unclassified Marinobacter TaxID=83889 RepID=UPI0026E42128|nr:MULTISPECIES: biotin--[acetyl-CoA-carboxylase] ligase [unclassified Marinobacter]MDO6444143.1 biotin--[acetyl-CoA-carboxylase] ligase [Marinobacter sp. 2_MG-2023]MDO6825300.1 biotin--[acetyl-CoA-carboxylase] ligase [Marinobacter sp. 1_MG-2023]
MKTKVLVSLLSDGQVHSGERLAEELGVSRTAVWKQVRRAAAEGFEIETVRGRGYKLVTPVDLLDAGVILDGLVESARNSICLTVLDEVDSTNTEILRQISDGVSGVPVAIADCQTMGRGRRGRPWRSPRGENLYLSAGLTFHGDFSVLDGLSLVLGVAVAETLEELGLPGVRLKWPNDIFMPDGKLGGILVELQGELQEGVIRVIAGIGINVHMSCADDVDQAWSSLDRVSTQAGWSRNRIASALIGTLLHSADIFAQKGFGAFQDAWQSRDLFNGQQLIAKGGELAGVGRGIDGQGNYLVEGESGVVPVRAGEISLRVAR